MKPAYRVACLAHALLGLPVEALNFFPRQANATTSSFSYTAGPFLGAQLFTWSQYITPTIVGTVHVTVDQAHNSTFSTTIYHTDFDANGTNTVLTRTDTNDAGTVTGSVLISKGITTSINVAYPTTVFVPSPEITWGAVLPITATGNYTELFPGTTTANFSLIPFSLTISDVGADGACCLTTQTFVATPSHTPFPSSGPLDTADPSGWLYTLVGWDSFIPSTALPPSAISSLWSPTPFSLDNYSGCGFTYCTYQSSIGIEPAAALSSQANLLATTTTTISAAPSTTTPSAAPENQPSTTAASSTPANPPPSSTTSAVAQQSPSPESSAPPAQQSTTTPQGENSPTTTAQQAATTTQGGQNPTTTPQGGNNPTTTTSPQGGNSPTTTQQPQASPPVVSGTPDVVVGGVTARPAGSSSSALLVGSQTLAPGSSITIGSGTSTTIVALRTSGSQTVLQVGTSEATLLQQPTQTTVANTSPVTVGGVVVEPASSGDVVVGGQTLAPGSSITLGSGTSTTVVALKTSGSETILQVGTQSTTLTDESTPVTVGGVALSPAASGGFVVGGETLTPGESVTLGSGTATTVVALQTSGSETILQVGTQSTTLTDQPGASTTDVGGYVVAGLGGPSATPTGGVASPSATSGPVTGTNSTGIAQSNDASGRTITSALRDLILLVVGMAVI